MWLLALLFVGWLFWWARHHQKERDLMVDLCAKAVFDNPKLRSQWRDQIEAHSFMRNDSTYLEAYGGGKAQLELQISLMKTVLRYIDVAEAQAKAANA